MLNYFFSVSKGEFGYMGLIGSNVPSPHGPMLQRWPFVVQLVRSELAALVGPRYGSIQGKQDIFFKDSSQTDTLLILQ